VENNLRQRANVGKYVADVNCPEEGIIKKIERR